VAEGLNSGADDFLTKPFIFGELKARLRAGDRVVEMHAQLMQKNKVVNDAFETIRTLYENVQNDLAEARRLQSSLVRETDIAYDGGHATMMLHPSGHVGGDLVGEFQISPTQLGVYSLDVSGHGVASALMTARLAGYLSGRTPSQNIALVEKADGTFAARDPAETAMRLNETLLRELETDLYFTMALAIIDLESGKVSCVQAGHPHPLVISNYGATQTYGEGGMPIGLLPDIEFESFEFELQPGDQLVLYSDGITEAENPNGEQLEEDGLAEIIRNCAGQKGSVLLDSLHDQLTTFCETAEFSDDVSALIFERTKRD
jgi:sigma-B regulation protein RsbU (phosphoserine phosphatase)